MLATMAAPAAELTLESSAFFYGIEYLAVFCCGLLGGLAAVRKKYDLFAILLTAWLTALGGGLVRDVILGVPPVGISDKGMVLTSLAAGLIVAVIHPEVDRMHMSMTVLDALALGLFAVNGTQKALIYGCSGMTSVFLGMFTALAGGLIRDVLLNEVPTVVRDRHWYAFPSLVGCLLTVASTRTHSAGYLADDAEIAVDAGIVVLVVLMRVASVSFDITLPGAMRRQGPVTIPVHGAGKRREDADGASGAGDADRAADGARDGDCAHNQNDAPRGES